MPNLIRNSLTLLLRQRECTHKLIKVKKQEVYHQIHISKCYSTENKRSYNNKPNDIKKEDNPSIIDADVAIVEKKMSDDVDLEELESNYQENLLDYYMKKAEGSIDNMDDIDYYDITDPNQRMFYKMVDIWLRDTGEAKRGHREFVKSVMKSLHKFNVETDIKAYLKLLDCFPDGQHTGIKRDKLFMAAFQDKIPDHELATNLVGLIATNGAVPNDKLYNKVTDLFGRFSPVTNAARNAIFWYPRLASFQDFLIPNTDLKTLSPIEAAFYGLRQMNPGIDAEYNVFPVDRGFCDEVLNTSEAIDKIISVQTPEQKLMLANHDVSTPIFVEGPHLVYMRGKKVQYYVMRSDPKDSVPVKKDKPTTLLTDKEWWAKFYGTDWETDKKFDNKTGKIYDEEKYFPSIDLEDGLGLVDNITHEIASIDKDTATVEGPVYAIASTDFTSSTALRSWISGLLPDNPIVSKCSIVFREEKPFLLNAPKEDPNESMYQDIFDKIIK